MSEQQWELILSPELIADLEERLRFAREYRDAAQANFILIGEYLSAAKHLYNSLPKQKTASPQSVEGQ